MASKVVAALALVGLAAASPKYPTHHNPPPPPHHYPSGPNATATVSWETVYIPSGTAAVAKAAATAKTSSPTSHVKGKAFDRYVSIWFENTDFDKATGDPNFSFFADRGISLTNFHGVTHPSQPNYISAFAGDYFGMNHDDLTRAPFNVSTVVDLLDTKDITWAMYQEDMPFSGFEGYEWLNQQNGANDYVRKHNPAATFDKVTHYEDNLSVIKNLSMIDRERSQFHKDLDANELPQWMFITPNMTSDAHDSDVTVAGAWLKKFLTPLLDDKNFMQNTLVLITFDENETYEGRNRILSVLLGDAVPEELHGTKDHSFYNHYSELASVEANWDLPTLGRFDVGANVYKLVGEKTGDTIREWTGDEFQSRHFNLSYAGNFNEYEGGNTEFPAPNLKLNDNAFNGRKILDEVMKTWEGSENPTYYEDTIKLYDGYHPPQGYKPAPEPSDE